ncbi:MAG: peptide-methionine (S)-S-oxide reductase MsrA [Chitinophagaceae bacterium]|nr:peptide-methionine (S)-S-oxide reductase MsrA [Chitinophagaceae bacterium]
MKTMKILFTTTLGLFLFMSCGNGTGTKSLQKKATTTENITINDSTNVIYFAGGCFWGTEHFFKQVDGVIGTEVGFANGHTENPTYNDVIDEDTGYAETVKVLYNPKKVDLKLLLDLYFLTIDPTSLDKQGNDYGDQYRTGIYYTSKEQLPIINERIKTEAAKHTRPIVVEVTPLKKYYKAEDYHQDYLENNPGGYCHINPALFQFAKDANKKNNH